MRNVIVVLLILVGILWLRLLGLIVIWRLVVLGLILIIVRILIGIVPLLLLLIVEIRNITLLLGIGRTLMLIGAGIFREVWVGNSGIGIGTVGGLVVDVVPEKVVVGIKNVRLIPFGYHVSGVVRINEPWALVISRLSVIINFLVQLAPFYLLIYLGTYMLKYF